MRWSHDGGLLNGARAHMSGVRETENLPTPQPAHLLDDVIYAPLVLHEIQLFDAESGAYIHSGQVAHTVTPWLDA